MDEVKRKPGRPKGSTNKKINTSNIITIDLEKQIPNAPTCRINPQGWINWGLDNLFPSQLTGLYYSSSTHKSCIDFIVTAICGDKLII